MIVEEIKKEHPDREVEVWAEDEARLGLQPVIRRMWAPKGKRPKAVNYRKYEWLYAYAFVRPEDGTTHWLLLPTVNTECMNIALKTFSEEMDPDGKKLIVLLMDQAGFHTGKDLEVPEGIRIESLPPYTPELQPVECLWPLLKESIANRAYETMDMLEAVLIKRINWLIENTQTVLGATGFGWIPRRA